MVKLSENAAKQMGYVSASDREKLHKAKMEERLLKRMEKQQAKREEQAQRQKEREEYRAYVKQQRQAALDADISLTEAVAEYRSIEASQSVRAKQRAEEQREAAILDHEQAKQKIRDLERRLAEAHQDAARAAEHANKMCKRYEEVVVEAAKSLDTARDRMREAWESNESAWRDMNKSFVKAKRDRSVRREAKTLLGLNKS